MDGATVTVTAETFSTKRKAAAAAAVEKGTNARRAGKGATRRKAEKGATRKAEKSAAGRKAEKGRTTTGRKAEKGRTTTGRKAEKGRTTTGRKAEQGIAAAGSAAEDSDLVESAPRGEITARLNKRFVDWILNRKWLSFSEDPDEHYNQMINDPDRPEEYTLEYLQEERDMMRELVAHNKRSRERFEKFQGWVRRELDDKGYVEVGESYIRQCAINRRSMPPELWNALMGGLMGELKLDDDDEDEDVVKPGAGGIAN